jgi:hypothetical protein
VADYFSLEALKNQLVYFIWLKVTEENLDQVLNFSIEEDLQELTSGCAKLKIKNIDEEISVFNNKHIEEAYKLNKF